MSRTLPSIPYIERSLVGEHRDAHVQLAAALGAAPARPARLLTRFAHRTMVAAIANVRPTRRGQLSPPLFPVPRSFLSATDRTRIEACAAAYRYVDSRLAMVMRGIEQLPALLPETPFVLNALAEGRLDNPDEMNPGMIRGVEFEGGLPVASYPAARRSECRALLEEAVTRVNTDAAPAVVRAAWMLHVLGEIHPFADGNGRVARLLYLLVTGEQMPMTVDWGVVEQLRFHQDTWSHTLKDRDVAPCAAATTELSTAGARLMLSRLGALVQLVSAIQHEFGLPEEEAALVAAVGLRRIGGLPELALDLNLTYAVALEASERLAAIGLLCRHHDLGQGPPLRPSYALGERSGPWFTDSLEALASLGIEDWQRQ